MQPINCYECGRLVMTVEEGSMIRKGTICFCITCIPKKSKDFQYDTPDFLKDLFKGKI